MEKGTGNKIIVVIKSKLSPATPHPHGINKIEDYRLKESIERQSHF
jgi:hypothetical protein